MQRLEKALKSCVALNATVQHMATTISQRDLRNNNADIMRRLEEGETFLITRNGKQIGTLTPSTRSLFVSTAELKKAFHALPAMSYAELRRDLDAVVDQDPTPRG